MAACILSFLQAQVKTTRLNPVTQTAEPYVPSWEKMGRVIVANSFVLFMVVFVLHIIGWQCVLYPYITIGNFKSYIQNCNSFFFYLNSDENFTSIIYNNVLLKKFDSENFKKKHKIQILGTQKVKKNV